MSALNLMDRARADVLAHKLDPQFERYAHSRLLARKFQELMYGQSPYQIWTMQPQLGKSTMGSKWGPVWALDWDPTLNFILTSYAKQLARRNARSCRNVLRDHHRNLRTMLAPDTTAADEWYTPEGGGILATGLDGIMAGFSADFMIIDDPHKNRREANSQHMRDVVWQWWTDDVQQRLQGDEKVLIVMTRWHPDDLVGRVLDREGRRTPLNPGGKWDVTHIPAVADSQLTPQLDPELAARGVPGDPLGRQDGEVACPERFSAETMAARKKTVGPIAWSSLYQGHPTLAEGNILIRSRWRLLNAIPNLSWADRLITSWDLAGGDDGDSWTVGQLWMKDNHSPSGTRYTLLDEVRGKWDFPEQAKQFRRFREKHPRATHHCIENKSNGRSLLQLMRSEGVSGLVPVNPTEDKVDRAVDCTDLHEDGQLFVPNWIGTDDEANAEETWVDQFISECADFPNGANDDRVDTMSQAIKHLRDPMIGNAAGAQYDHADTRGR